jgi:Spy/CpxP family protein refolding chaperone
MKSSKLLISAAALVLGALAWMSLPVTAQGVKWWQSEPYKKELGLTADQTRRLEDVFQKALPTLKVQKTALDDAEAKFERLVERGDDREVMEQVNLVEAARAELNKTRTMMLLGMRKVLTREQWTKFNVLHQAAERAAKPGDGAKKPNSAK